MAEESKLHTGVKKGPKAKAATQAKAKPSPRTAAKVGRTGKLSTPEKLRPGGLKVSDATKAQDDDLAHKSDGLTVSDSQDSNDPFSAAAIGEDKNNEQYFDSLQAVSIRKRGLFGRMSGYEDVRDPIEGMQKFVKFNQKCIKAGQHMFPEVPGKTPAEVAKAKFNRIDENSKRMLKAYMEDPEGINSEPLNREIRDTIKRAAGFNAEKWAHKAGMMTMSATAGGAAVAATVATGGVAAAAGGVVAGGAAALNAATSLGIVGTAIVGAGAAATAPVTAPIAATALQLPAAASGGVAAIPYTIASGTMYELTQVIQNSPTKRSAAEKMKMTKYIQIIENAIQKDQPEKILELLEQISKEKRLIVYDGKLPKTQLFSGMHDETLRQIEDIANQTLKQHDDVKNAEQGKIKEAKETLKQTQLELKNLANDLYNKTLDHLSHLQIMADKDLRKHVRLVEQENDSEFGLTSSLEEGSKSAARCKHAALMANIFDGFEINELPGNNSKLYCYELKLGQEKFASVKVDKNAKNMEITFKESDLVSKDNVINHQKIELIVHQQAQYALSAGDGTVEVDVKNPQLAMQMMWRLLKQGVVPKLTDEVKADIEQYYNENPDAKYAKEYAKINEILEQIGNRHEAYEKYQDIPINKRKNEAKPMPPMTSQAIRALMNQNQLHKAPPIIDGLKSKPKPKPNNEPGKGPPQGPGMGGMPEIPGMGGMGGIPGMGGMPGKDAIAPTAPEKATSTTNSGRKPS